MKDRRKSLLSHLSKKLGYENDELFVKNKCQTLNLVLERVKLFKLPYTMKKVSVDKFGEITIIQFRDEYSNLIRLFYLPNGKKLKVNRKYKVILKQNQRINQVREKIKNNSFSTNLIVKELEEKQIKRPLEIRALKHLKEVLHEQGLIDSDLSELQYSYNRLLKTFDVLINHDMKE